MISIVIPLYNKEKQIAKTLNAVFRQTFQNYEIIIVNDGSTDNGMKIVEGFDDPRIRIINQINQGVSVARNKGIGASRYSYVALLDADDEWDADYLETQVSFVRKYPECKIFASAYQLRNYKNENSSILLNNLPFLGGDGILNNYFKVAVHSHPPLWTSAVVVEKKAILAIGGFPVGVTAGEDLLTWARLAVNYPIAYSREPKAYFIQGKSESYEEAPSRIPQKPDVVGEELVKLLNDYPEVKGLRHYIAIWFKMRVSMFLLLGKDSDAFYDSLKALKYDFFNYKLWIYLAMILLPVNQRRRIFAKFGNR